MGADGQVDVAWDWLTGEVRDAAEAFVSQLRTIEATERAGTTPVPNLEWNVAELTAHIISLPDVYRAQNSLPEPFTPPDSWADFSREARAHITSTDLSELSDQLLTELDRFLDELGPDGTTPWTLYGQATTAGNLAAGEDGTLTVGLGKPARADCHLIADPATYLLLSLERTSQIKAALTGKMIGYGRKPWLFNRLAMAKVDGV
jgi:hypothetical protein